MLPFFLHHQGPVEWERKGTRFFSIKKGGRPDEFHKKIYHLYGKKREGGGEEGDPSRFPKGKIPGRYYRPNRTTAPKTGGRERLIFVRSGGEKRRGKEGAPPSQGGRKSGRTRFGETDEEREKEKRGGEGKRRSDSLSTKYPPGKCLRRRASSRGTEDEKEEKGTVILLYPAGDAAKRKEEGEDVFHCSLIRRA